MTPAKRKILSRELKQLDKLELISCLTILAEKVPEVWDALEGLLNLEPQTLADLVSRTEMAISSATDCEDWEFNRNYDYDSAAYVRIQKKFRQLIKLGQLEAAMKLAERLAAEGSYQVEVSDEGLMSTEIE